MTSLNFLQEPQLLQDIYNNFNGSYKLSCFLYYSLYPHLHSLFTHYVLIYYYNENKKKYKL